MGGGPQKEHLLCTLPNQEPKDIFERLRKRFPDIKVTYRNVSFTQDRAQLEKELPIGTPNTTPGYNPTRRGY